MINPNYRRYIIVLKKEYNAMELKTIIGQCDLLIGSRYHSIVAALSQGIPVLAIGWHHKYHEIMKLVNLENFVFNIDEINKKNVDEILKEINNLLENAPEIKLKILDKISQIKMDICSSWQIS